MKMGFKGKKKTAKGMKKKKGMRPSGLLGAAGELIGGAAGVAAGAPGAPGMTGLFKVDRFGNIIKVQQKRRKKGYRMPRMLAEFIRSAIETNRAVNTAVILNATAGRSH